MRNFIIAATAVLLSTVAHAQNAPNLVGEHYTVLRQNLWKAGYRPLFPSDRTGCNLVDQRCSQFPEMDTCSLEGTRLCLTRWRSADYRERVYIATTGLSPIVAMIRVRTD